MHVHKHTRIKHMHALQTDGMALFVLLWLHAVGGEYKDFKVWKQERCSACGSLPGRPQLCSSFVVLINLEASGSLFFIQMKHYD